MKSIANCFCGEPLWICATCCGAHCLECDEHDEIGCAQDEDRRPSRRMRLMTQVLRGRRGDRGRNPGARNTHGGANHDHE
jgi:hypothetical protein